MFGYGKFEGGKCEGKQIEKKNGKKEKVCLNSINYFYIYFKNHIYIYIFFILYKN